MIDVAVSSSFGSIVDDRWPVDGVGREDAAAIAVRRPGEAAGAGWRQIFGLCDTPTLENVSTGLLRHHSEFFYRVDSFHVHLSNLYDARRAYVDGFHHLKRVKPDGTLHVASGKRNVRWLSNVVPVLPDLLIVSL